MTKSEYLFYKRTDDDTIQVMTSHLATMNKPYNPYWANTVLDLIVVKNNNFPEQTHIHEMLSNFFSASYYDTDVEISNSTPKAHVRAFNEYYRKHYQSSVRKSIASNVQEPDYDLSTGDGCDVIRSIHSVNGYLYETTAFSVADFMSGCESLYAKHMKDKTFKQQYPDIADAYNKCYRLYKAMTGNDWVMFSNTKTSYIKVQL